MGASELATRIEVKASGAGCRFPQGSGQTSSPALNLAEEICQSPTIRSSATWAKLCFDNADDWKRSRTALKVRATSPTDDPRPAGDAKGVSGLTSVMMRLSFIHDFSPEVQGYRVGVSGGQNEF